MSKTSVQSVVVYAVRKRRLLVFRHVEESLEEVGLQVPAGPIASGEDPAAAALRRLRETTGRRSFAVEDYLGRAAYDLTPYRHEHQERFFFLARCTEAPEERWTGGEIHEGKRTRLEFFWIPVVQGHVLGSGLGALLGALPEDVDD